MPKGKGFIASVTNKKAFYLLKTNKNASVTEYNQYFITFGNIELRFKIGSDILNLNIGHTHRSFDTGTLKNG
jgi:hypothetical protein